MSDTPKTDALMHLLAGVELNMPSLLQHAREQERLATFFQSENQMRADTARRYHAILGYNNDDGRHVSPGPEEMLIALKTQHAALRSALQEIRDMHDGEEDVEDGPDGIANRPNRAMRVNQIIDAAL